MLYVIFMLGFRERLAASPDNRPENIPGFAPGYWRQVPPYETRIFNREGKDVVFELTGTGYPKVPSRAVQMTPIRCSASGQLNLFGEPTFEFRIILRSDYHNSVLKDPDCK